MTRNVLQHVAAPWKRRTAAALLVLVAFLLPARPTWAQG
jgi:hypothetical protein